MISWLGGILSSVLLNHDEQQDNHFRYNFSYLRENLPNFYFNNNDCGTIVKALERNKMLQCELDYLLRYNDLEDSIQQLINQGKITL